MNRKGQVLITFILVVPLLILFGTFIYDMGYLHYQKAKGKSAITDAIIYILNQPQIDELTKQQAIKQIRQNVMIDNIQITSSVEGVKIQGQQVVKGLLLSFLKNEYGKIEFVYQGIKQDEKIIIKEA